MHIANGTNLYRSLEEIIDANGIFDTLDAVARISLNSVNQMRASNSELTVAESWHIATTIPTWLPPEIDKHFDDKTMAAALKRIAQLLDFSSGSIHDGNAREQFVTAKLYLSGLIRELKP